MRKPWRIGAFPPGTKLEWIDGTLWANDVPFTETEGWLPLPLYVPMRIARRTDEVRVRITVRTEPDAVETVFIDCVRYRDTEFPSLHDFAQHCGGGWINYVTHSVRRCMEVHASIFRKDRPRASKAASADVTGVRQRQRTRRED